MPPSRSGVPSEPAPKGLSSGSPDAEPGETPGCASSTGESGSPLVAEARAALNLQSERKTGTEKSEQGDAWREVICTPDPAVRRMMLAGLGVAFFSQACGADLAIVYSSEILSP